MSSLRVSCSFKRERISIANTISPPPLPPPLAIFCCEMVLKLLADGFFQYVKSGFNVFDGSIVMLSLLELLEEHGSGLSVLRTFRLLRILKLVYLLLIF